MDVVYWVSFLVGGFFVLLSMIGGDTDTDADADFDMDHDADFDVDHDVEFDMDHDVDTDTDVHVGSGDVDMSPDFVDLFTIRALFLFAAFFGLTGVLLSLVGTAEPTAGIMAAVMGLIAGLGGDYIIKQIGYAHISSAVTAIDLKGRTGTVIIPFEGENKGKTTFRPIRNM